MAELISNLTTLDETAVDAAATFLAEAIAEQYPNYEVRHGAFRDLVIQMHAILMVGVVTPNIDAMRASNSLAAIEEDGTSADTDVVDRVLSNYRVTRLAGSASTGFVSFVINSLVPVTIAANAKFTANGIEFRTTTSYSAKTSAGAVVSDTDVLLTSIGGGRYVFTFPITATTDDARGNLRRGTLIAPDTVPSVYVSASAASDFSGGAVEETNAELLERLHEGASIKAWSDRTAIAAMLKSQEEFATIESISVVGAADDEMTRDRHWIFPISGGGRCDLYARTTKLPTAFTIAKTCLLVGIDNDTGYGIWQCSISPSEGQAFYIVSRVALSSDDPSFGGYEVVDDVRDFAVPSSGWSPDVQSADEAAYTAFQSASFTFRDTATATSALTVGTSTQEYDVSLLAMPLIAELQEFLSDRDHRPTAADVLVRAPTPCFLRVSFKIHHRSSQTSPDTATIASDVSDAVNSQQFVGRLFASTVINAVSPSLEEGMEISAIDLFARIRKPDGTYLYVRDPDVLELPSDPEAGVSERTLAIFLDPDDVGIELVID